VMRVLIVDDEPLARRGVRRLLEGESDVEIVGEAGSGTQALEKIRTLAPDLVFLDIQMPEMDGLELVATIGPGAMPAVVFITAFDRYAIEAFDLHAADYVLKPVDPERFQRALQRARARVAGGEREELETRLRRLLEGLRGTRGDRLVIRSAGKVQFVRVDEIDWVHAEDNYCRIYAGGATYLMRETVTGLEARLDPSLFVRIRRSTIVRVDRIREIRPLLNGTFELLLLDGTRIVSSRRFREKVEGLMR
jgi:two-component system LytT family response regulator